MRSIARKQLGLLNTIGNTPLVELVNLNTNPRVKVFAKVEGGNPAVRSKTARHII